MRGPERRRPRGQCLGRVTLGKGPGAPACHVSVVGELLGECTPQCFRELVGSEAVPCPGVPLLGIRQREFLPREPRVPTTIPCKGTKRKLEGMARICEDTNTGDGNLG